MRPIAYIVFIISGAAGLIYESIWARYLGLFVGHTAYSQVLVLTIFLGGMALGAMLIGQRSSKLRDPLRGYAFVELALAVIALVFHGLFLKVTRASGWLIRRSNQNLVHVHVIRPRQYEHYRLGDID